MKASDFPAPKKATGRMKPCHRCSTPFYCPPSKDVGGSLPERKYCGNDCFVAHRASPEGISERFWAKVEKTDGCWLFRGCIGHEGYGSFACGRPTKQWQAHRFAWFDHTGVMPPPDKAVCHKCDNPPCVRPDHLFLGTWKDNNDDKMRKGRYPLSLLTDDQVREVRKQLETKPAIQIAAELKVRRQIIWDIQKGRTYTHVAPSHNDAKQRLEEK